MTTDMSDSAGQHGEGVPTGMSKTPAFPADEHAEDIAALRQKLHDIEREKSALEQRSAAAEAQLIAARERGDEHLKRAEQAEARLDQMLANQTAMALTLKDQQHLIGEKFDRTEPEEPAEQTEPGNKPRSFLASVTHLPTSVSPPHPTPTATPDPGREGVSKRMRRWRRR